MPSLYELLEIDPETETEAIKQRILDRFLEYDAEFGYDDGPLPLVITRTLKAEPALLLIGYETLCNPDKRTRYDGLPVQYRISDGRLAKDISAKLEPNPSIDLNGHVSALVRSGRLPGNNHYIAASLVVWPSPENAFTPGQEASLDAKIRLVGAKYLARHLKNQIDPDIPPVFTGDEEGNIIINAQLISVAVELFVRHPHLKELFHLACQNVNPATIRTLEAKVGGKSARETLSQLFFNENFAASFNKIRWLGDAIAVLKTVKLDSPENISWLIQATKKAAWERVKPRDLSALLRAIPRIDAIEELCDGSGEIYTNCVYPDEMMRLNQCLDKMLTHGLRILLENTANAHTRDAEIERRQASAAITLAIELKSKLVDFGAKPKEEQQTSLSAFKTDFTACLHSHDTSTDASHMGKHRKLWKVIAANTLLALTGIGLLAIGVNLAIHHRFFGQRTHREELRDEVGKSLSTFKTL